MAIEQVTITGGNSATSVSATGGSYNSSDTLLGTDDDYLIMTEDGFAIRLGVGFASGNEETTTTIQSGGLQSVTIETGNGVTPV